jgi:16S rRNA (cytidine1402-2'-O)-methyltransferase
MPLNSPSDEKRGCLFVVATPIGNPDDITLRAVAILGQVHLVAAEDTRLTGRLLTHLGLSCKLVSYHEHNEDTRTPWLLERLKGGLQVALVSDAGTPMVSDPGYRLIRTAAAEGIRVVPVPGVSAAVAALSAAGLPTDSFVFAGFPPKKKKRRQQLLADLAGLGRTVILYESPRRIATLVTELLAVCGDRDAVLAREMTKPHEEFIRGPLSHLEKALKQRSSVKGECTLVMAGISPQRPAADETATEQIRMRVAAGEGPGKIAKALAGTVGLSRNQIYTVALEMTRAVRADDCPDAS